MPTKVMVVDDDPQANHLLKLLLELDGFDVVLCPRGEKAVAVARAEKPAVALMDVHIAGTDGLAVLREMRQDPALAGLPVVMFSGMNLEYECMAAGANAFILKPYQQEELTAALSKVIA
jgi:adenylate cyclase